MHLLLHHTHHGYSDGHSLLTSSVNLTPLEAIKLAQLSDLSGPLPFGVTPAPYETGYHCGRFYAFARTWYDTAAPRTGCVHTHTILIPERLTTILPSPYSVAAAFDPNIPAEACEQLHVQAGPVVHRPYASHHAFPIAVPAENVAVFLESCFRPGDWPQFCTLAYHPVRFRGHLLDVYGVPEGLEGRFAIIKRHT